MSSNLNKIVTLILDDSNDDALVEIQNNKKMHSYSDVEWLDATCQLSKYELGLLINNLILIRKRNGLHTGGSVSPVRWLYGVYINNYEDISNELYNWIIQNSENPYEPTGNYHNR